MMKRIMAAIAGGALMTTGALSEPIGDIAASKRMLLVFSPDGHPALARQGEFLREAGSAAFVERDLVVLHVPLAGMTRVLIGNPAGPYASDELRRGRKVTPDAGFTALLIGKDGGTKWRSNQPTSTEAIFSVIDSMPMRMIEMKRNGPAG